MQAKSSKPRIWTMGLLEDGQVKERRVVEIAPVVALLELLIADYADPAWEHWSDAEDLLAALKGS